MALTETIQRIAIQNSSIYLNFQTFHRAVQRHCQILQLGCSSDDIRIPIGSASLRQALSGQIDVQLMVIPVFCVIYITLIAVKIISRIGSFTACDLTYFCCILKEAILQAVVSPGRTGVFFGSVRRIRQLLAKGITFILSICKIVDAAAVTGIPELLQEQCPAKNRIFRAAVQNHIGESQLHMSACIAAHCTDQAGCCAATCAIIVARLHTTHVQIGVAADAMDQQRGNRSCIINLWIDAQTVQNHTVNLQIQLCIGVPALGVALDQRTTFLITDANSSCQRQVLHSQSLGSISSLDDFHIGEKSGMHSAVLTILIRGHPCISLQSLIIKGYGSIFDIPVYFRRVIGIACQVQGTTGNFARAIVKIILQP